MRFADFLIEQTKVDFDPTVGTGTGGVDFDTGAGRGRAARRVEKKAASSSGSLIQIMQYLKKRGSIDTKLLRKLTQLQAAVNDLMRAIQAGDIEVAKLNEQAQAPDKETLRLAQRVEDALSDLFGHVAVEDPGRFLKAMRQLSQQGQVDDEMLGDLKRLQQVANALVQTAETGETGKAEGEQKQQAKTEQMRPETKKWARPLVELIARKPNMREKINKLILSAYRQKRAEGTQQ